MQQDKNVILIGGGGHSLNCAQIFIENNFKIFGFIDLKPNAKLNKICGLNYLGNDNAIKKYILEKKYLFFIAIAGFKSTSLRIKLHQYVTKHGGEFANCLSKDAYIAENAKIGKNVAVFPKAVVNSYANLNDNVIINSGAIIEHEVVIKKNVHVAPNATILGNVHVGENSFIGSGSIIKQGTVIRENEFINANLFYDK
tara:strand:- start:169 stop:762 length:594 start_codon:yes stop_codon:yes gene_type:complete